MKNLINIGATEEEQADQIKAWIKSNGLQIAIGIAIGFASIWGWNFYNDYQDQQNKKARALYLTYTGNTDNSTVYDKLLADHGSSSYAEQVKLLMAKQLFESGNYKSALSLIEPLTNSDDNAISSTAVFSTARVYFEMGQHDKALETLDSLSDINYIVNAWKKNNGNLDQIHTAVIERAISSTEPKFQWPMTWLFQVVRLSGATYFKGWDEFGVYNKGIMDAREIFEELGQSFWHERQPDGYSSDKKEWLSGEMFERRIRFADAIYTAGYPTSNPDEIMDRIGANETTRNLVNSFSGRKDQFIALMCSPELMGFENA
jgi:predicted negative regulator of RcsB-dependent stress response